LLEGRKDDSRCQRSAQRAIRSKTHLLLALQDTGTAAAADAELPDSLRSHFAQAGN
jgi:hypothetical protein